MHYSFYFAIGTVLVLVAVGLVWRFSSRRRELPCPAWLHWMVELDNPFTKTNRSGFIIDRLDLREGMAVLDAGCGPGRLTVPAAPRVGPGGGVLAMDIQSGMLARVQEKVSALGLGNVRFLEAGIGEGKLPVEQFDRALLVTVLGELTDPARGLREIFAALKPGGLLSVTEVIFDPHFQRRGTVAALAREAGFTVGETWGHALAYVLHLEKPAR
ncbi:class I SAM-dependent methyltransferase [Niveibacterium sp. SC-1]|uniref:class I SAM-dependent methyltransferase n=1 Tax=Niveibacterium sp. SC-1 TaxID=3135646 RepID=UPI00311D7F4F